MVDKNGGGESRRKGSGKIRKLDGAIRAFKEDLRLEEMSETYEVLGKWSEVVGEKLGKHIRPIQLKNTTLYVKADSAVWMNEFSFVKREAIKSLNERLGRSLIKDIRFKN